jgi:hypothetical protein
MYDSHALSALDGRTYKEKTMTNGQQAHQAVRAIADDVTGFGAKIGVQGGGDGRSLSTLIGALRLPTIGEEIPTSTPQGGKIGVAGGDD